MQIEMLTIAEAATSHGGHLNILGSFGAIYARTFPTRHESCCIVCKIQLVHEDSGEHELKISIIDPDGAPVMAPNINRFSCDLGPHASRHHITILKINGFPVEKPGTFYIDALVDGELLSRATFHMLPAQPRPRAGEG